MRLGMTQANIEAITPLGNNYPVLSNAGDYKLSDEYLTRRFSRPSRQAENVIYEVTCDPAYLHQYYRLREEMFVNVWGLNGFSGQKDEYDDDSDIIIARIGNQVIGGCRLTTSSPGDRKKLPIEKYGFSLEGEFPELPLHETIYVEISRMAILPEYQNSVVILELIRKLLKRGAEKKARFAFSMSPVVLARNYRKAVNLLGFKWKIRGDIKIADREEYEGIRMVVSTFDLAPLYHPIPKSEEYMGEPLLLVGA